jgi:hypothetical protein
MAAAVPRFASVARTTLFDGRKRQMRGFTLQLTVLLGAALFPGATVACPRAHRLRCDLPIDPATDLRKVELTPDAAKQALLEMMRSEPGKALGFFEASLVDEMSKAAVEKRDDGWYHWTGAYRFRPASSRYVLFVSLGDPQRPPLRPHPQGRLAFLRVYEGTFELNDGRWVATVPRYKYTLLD